MLLAPLVLVGCGGIEPVAPHAPITDPAQLFMSVTLDHAAVTLSTAPTHGTLQLTATPVNAAGEPLSGLPAASFRSLDTASVHVTGDGVLEARRVSAGARVIAEIVAPGNIRHSDTVVVNVTDDPAPPVLTRLSLEPVPGDSAVWPMRGPGFGEPFLTFTGLFTPPAVVVRALDEQGSPIPGLAVEYRSLDRRIVSFDESGVLMRHQPGEVALVARATAYGVQMADTLIVTLTYPITHQVVVMPGTVTFEPSEVTIRRGGLVIWVNNNDPVDVTFDAPAAVGEMTPLCMALAPLAGEASVCGSGDIPEFVTGEGEFLGVAIRTRHFPVAGVYTYRDTHSGATGRVVVTD